jgi:hypothetical protein
MAYLATSPDFCPPQDRFVMTSWHERESLEDIAEFFVLNTSFDSFKPGVFVIIAVGDSPDLKKAERLVRELLAEKLRLG